MSGTEIRNFRWEDLEPLTRIHNEVSGVAGSDRAFDLESIQQMLSQPSCSAEEDCFVAVSDGSLVGFALVGCELPIGRTVASGGVLESRRHEGIGRSLLESVVRYTSSINASVLHVEAPSDGAEARHMLESEGFREIKRYWKMRWEGPQAPAVALQDGFELRPFKLGQDEAALTALQNAAFSDSWGFCPNTVEEISARVRFSRCYPEGIIFATDGHRLAAYNWTMRTSSGDGGTGWVAMTGVHPDYRSRGLGRAVVVAGMEYLKAMAVDTIELEVDSENEPATKLYLGLGFRPVAHGTWYEKELRQQAESPAGQAS
ncbi:MAG: GNAT family N-acetyltransferase [Chloroflexi bacterium]|nr:GNAT family N-acetyltransferase [Chloroflexota bacterium]